MSIESISGLGVVKVFTTENRGFTAEEIADRALDKIIYVGDKSHPLVSAQAHAFKDNIRKVLVHYLDEAQRNERMTIQARLRETGYPEIADLIGEL
jgi:hypothetical protein